MRAERFVRTQRDYYRRADAGHFAWQTEGPYFSGTERMLVTGAEPAAGRLLEIGCGEGGNLFHLRDRAQQRFGIDFSTAKAAFARQATGAEVLAADGARLPFASESFDAVLIRDLLHHVPEPARVLKEAHRVLRAGGKLTVVEPNARAPLVLLQALTVTAERGLLRSTRGRLEAAIRAAGFRQLEFHARQPFPVARVVLHPAMGLPRLGRSPLVQRALDAFDRVAGQLLPQSAWFYLVFQGEKS